ncbi:ribulose-phosphate 3-epimerase [Aureispira anguillae]|uniref:Ribulose-phosphate 3-epimerase n=1 Tax=Aureispira anguillae TaxID=2864201 RepID=A0A916DSC5_9BACT|nr:ribulose-phosphate 3-epimerase [Aureispira anguillae]BDS12444.1 ribulose-phosphate 3-epimerase [Aureispira anguillae]
MKHLIAPSILAADFANMGRDIQMLHESNADWVHVDVMDGRFVPNISFGFPVLKAIKPLTDKVMDCHLMIVEPEKYVEAFAAAGADIITIHYEATNHLHRAMQQIKATGAKAGVALNPHTRVDLLFDILEEIDLVCLMSVNPGFGGQKFIYSTLQKVRDLKAEIERRNLTTKIEIDGGVGLQNAEVLLQAGADVLVAGSAVFKADNPKDMIDKLKQVGAEKVI